MDETLAITLLIMIYAFLLLVADLQRTISIKFVYDIPKLALESR